MTPNFNKLLAAVAAANISDGIATVSFLWLASSITRDPVQISLIATATRLPWLFFSLPAGVITDWYDRRNLIVLMDVARAAILLALSIAVFLAPELPTPAELSAGLAMPSAGAGYLLVTLYLCALLLGMAEVLRDNAGQTLVPSIVADEDLSTANGRLWSVELVANSFLGPPLAGILIAVALPLPFVAQFACFLVSAFLISRMRGSFRANTPNKGMRAEMLEGMRWLWQHALLRNLAIVLGLVNGLEMMSFAIIVLFAQDILGLDSAGFGFLLTAGAVGGVLGGIIGPAIVKRMGSGRTLAVVLGVLALKFLVVALTSSVMVVWLTFFVSAFMGVLWNIVTVTLRQQIIPDALLGRVNSVYRFFGWGVMPLGTILGGLVVVGGDIAFTHEAALRLPFAIAGAGYIVLMLFALRNFTDAAITKAQDCPNRKARKLQPDKDGRPVKGLPEEILSR